MKFSTLLAFSTTAYGLAFDGPLPTPVTDLVYAALTGFSPKPTNNVRALPDLFRRQKPANPGVCGYLNGDSGMSAPGNITPQDRPPTFRPPLHFQHNTNQALNANQFARLPCILHIQLIMHLLRLSKMVRLLRRQQLRRYDTLHKFRIGIELSR
jgi:hypothetical protein